MKLHNVPVERRRRYKHSPISHAVVTITFIDPSQSGSYKYLEKKVHDVRRRSQMTAEWLEGVVDEMLQRDDLESLTVRSIDVTAVESVWSTPYEHLYPTTENPVHCTRCEEKLDSDKAVYLELDTNTGIYHREGSFPSEGLSQGFFPFGAACARRIAGKKED